MRIGYFLSSEVYTPHYTVENARIYTRPDEPPKVFASAFGPNPSTSRCASGDGFFTTQSDAEQVKERKAKAGSGKPAQAGYKVCEDPSTSSRPASWSPRR